MSKIIPSFSPPSRGQLLAWGVHLFTASGAVWGMLALLAIMQADWVLALSWMGIATFVDAADGTLARRFRVKEVLPGFDGALLDNMVDYFTYVIVPALFLYQANLLPENLAIIGASLIILTSAYQFAQADAKTEDHYFKGFPSYWNIVAFYLLVLKLSSWANFALILFFSIMVFVPIKYVYHSRTVHFRKLTLVLSLIWGVMVVAIVILYPQTPTWLVWGSLIYVIYYVGVSLYLMQKGK